MKDGTLLEQRDTGGDFGVILLDDLRKHRQIKAEVLKFICYTGTILLGHYPILVSEICDIF